MTIDPDKLVVGKVTLTDGAGKPVDGATVSVKGDMSHAGMQPVFGDTKSSTNGVYRIPFEWTMGGDWFVLITGKLADGRKVKEKVDMPGVKSR